MLTDSMRRFVMSNGRGYDKATQHVYHQRLKQYALNALGDLGLIAENMSEKVQGQIFNNHILIPFFELVLNINGEISDKDHEARRKRLLSLIRELLFTLEKNEMDRKLAPQVWNVLRHSPRSRLKTLNVIEAIFIASLNQ